jgi:predicted nuclease with TOPRIM domain
MKKLFILCLFTLTFLFPCINGFSDILKDLKNFEESLSDWVVQTNELSQRLSELEGDREAREKQIADYNQSMTNIEDLITDLNAKVDKVAKMSSLEGVKDIVKSFEGTLDVFKKRFSKLAKRLEDQEVKTAVLEKIYKTAQKPVETMMQAVDEQNEVVNKLAKRLNEQEKTLLTIKEGLKNQTTPTETLVKGIEELNSRLSNLESGVVVRKAEEIVEREPEAEIKEKVVISKAPIKETIEVKGFIDIGRGFFIKNIEFKPFGSSTYASGEIMNKSDRDHGIAEFKFQVYNKEDVLLESHRFSVGSLRRDSTKAFEEVIVGVKPKNIAKYAVFFAEMSLVSATGEEEIKIIERKPKVAMKKAEIGKEESTAKKAWETAKELEGFENIGSGFFIRNVSFDSFGSSSTVTGEIKNNSKKDYYLATFVMKIYSNYGMITNFDFSVRRFKSGDIKPFKEIITGARPVDIDRYEIVLKKFY